MKPNHVTFCCVCGGVEITLVALLVAAAKKCICRFKGKKESR